MVSLDHFVLVLLAFIVLGLVSSVLSPEIVWEERLRNDCIVLSGMKNRNSINQSIVSVWRCSKVLDRLLQSISLTRFHSLLPHKVFG